MKYLWVFFTQCQVILYHFMRSRHRCCNVLYCQYLTRIRNTSLCGSQGHIICRMSLEISVYLSTGIGIIRVIYACSHHFTPVFNSDIPWPSVRVDGLQSRFGECNHLKLELILITSQPSWSDNFLNQNQRWRSALAHIYFIEICEL